MKKLFISAFSALILLSTSPFSSAPALAATGANGSFEIGTDPGGTFTTLTSVDTTDIASWSVELGSIDYISGYWPASNGSRSIDLNGLTTGTISQTFPTTIGETYTVTFDLSGNPDSRPVGDAYWSPNAKVVAVSATGAAAQNFAYDTAAHANTLSNMLWESHAYSFVATAANTTLTFASQIPGAFGPAIDNVAISDSADNSCTLITLKSGVTTMTAGYTQTTQTGPSTALLAGSYSSGVFVPATVTQPVIPPWVDPAADGNFSGSGALWVSTHATWPGGAGNSEGDGHHDQWRLFQDSFVLPVEAVVNSANLSYSADNAADVHLNGSPTPIATTGTTYDPTASVSFNSPYIFASAHNAPLSPVAGLNTISFVIRNWGDSSEQNQFFDVNPTGLVYKATVNYCVPVAPADQSAPTSASVHIAKYLDGAHATAGSANGTAFPMLTTFNASNIGSATNAPFTLDQAGWYGDPAYEASFSNAAIGSSYSTWENTSTGAVGESCDGLHPYALVGYTTGATWIAAAAASPSAAVPNFPNLTSDQYVIVWNKTCQVTPPIKVHILKYLNGAKADAASAGGYQFPMTATWQASNLSGGVSTSGNYVLGNNHGGASDQYGADTAPMNAPADYTTSEVTGGASLVVASPEACVPGRYVLNGYRTSGVSFADAAVQTLTTSAPAFVGLSADRYVIVDNSTCPLVPPAPTTGTISGMKYNDLNRNGKKDNGEPGLPGWKIRLILDYYTGGSGDLDILIATATTDANGNYSFANVVPGTYDIREIHQKGWKRMSKNPKDIVIVAGSDVGGVNFGNAAKQKKEDEDNDKDDNRDDQPGEYHAHHGHSNYDKEQHSKEHDHKDNDDDHGNNSHH